jgi:hypothetical protein
MSGLHWSAAIVGTPSIESPVSASSRRDGNSEVSSPDLVAR